MIITEPDTIARGTVVSLDDDHLVLAIPETEYRLHLVPGAPIDAAPGARIEGVIEAVALRIHGASGGGRFIEPVYGAPRIVAGTVQRIDAAAARALVNVAVPMWVTWPKGQDLSVLTPGAFVTFHVRSGTRFTPATA